MRSWLRTNTMGGTAAVSALLTLCGLSQDAVAQDEGACCIAGLGIITCEVMTAEDCAANEGEFQGVGETCPNLCNGPGADGACCVIFGNSAACFLDDPDGCAAQGGTYGGDGSSCDEIECLPTPEPGGACCLFVDIPGSSGSFCLDSSATQCAFLGGEYQGDNTTCEETVCESEAPQPIIDWSDPPKDNPFLADIQPFRDVLDTGNGAALTDGIGGGSGDMPPDQVRYHPITVAFTAAPSPAPAPENITVTCVGGAAGMGCPGVTSVDDMGAAVYEITLDHVIPPGACMTIAFNGSAAGQQLQYQSLPGDVGMDGTVNTADLLALVMAINNGQAALASNLPRYDVNRSGGVSTQDLLRIIQLLNGVNAPVGMSGMTVATCP